MVEDIIIDYLTNLKLLNLLNQELFQEVIKVHLIINLVKLIMLIF